MDRLLVVLTGLTASGKTAMAIELAERYSTSIISADSRQIFKDLPIGTAAPSAEERSRVEHFLVGTHELGDYYSAAEFEADALAILDRLWQKSPVAIVCGGSMMYVDALINGIDDMPTVSDSTRNYVLSLYEQHGLEGVLAQLQICDPVYYAEVDKSNTRRVVHALEVSLEAGKPYSDFRTGRSRKRDFNILKFALNPPREQLFERINSRVEAMFEAGFEQEARRAFAKGNYNSLNTIGYKEMRAYFDGTFDFETAKSRMAKNTRVYAKKQLTWLRRDPSVIYINSVDEAIKLIDAELNN